MPSGPKKRRAAANKKKGTTTTVPDKYVGLSDNVDNTIVHANANSVDQQDHGKLGSQENKDSVQQNELNKTKEVQSCHHEATGEDGNVDEVLKGIKTLEGSLTCDECIANKLVCIEEKVNDLVERTDKIKSSLVEVVLDIQMLVANSLKIQETFTTS